MAIHDTDKTTTRNNININQSIIKSKDDEITMAGEYHFINLY